MSPAGAAKRVLSDGRGLITLGPRDQSRGQGRGRGEGVGVVGAEDPLPPFVQFFGD